MGKQKQGPRGLESRIVGDGEVAPDQLLANPANWRKHPKEQVDALEGLLKQVGWVQRVIVNRTTGHVVDGHARVELAIRRSEKSVPVVYVELTPEEENLVLASLDPIGGLATTDSDKLAELLADLKVEDEALKAMLHDLAEQAGADLSEMSDADVADALSDYSTKIESPAYTPKGEKPDVTTLADRTKTDRLIERIRATPELPTEVRHFLELAAQRHTVFDYHSIAEYYCHASPEVQDLMEQSALVIIDFDRAIEEGYVELSKKLASIYLAAYPDGQDDEDVAA